MAKWLFRRLKFLTAESDTTVSSSTQFLEKLKGDLAIETIELLLQSKYDETENRLGHAQILQLLKLCHRTYFTFDGTVYEQVKGTPMGSPISGFIAGAVLQRTSSAIGPETDEPTGAPLSPDVSDSHSNLSPEAKCRYALIYTTDIRFLKGLYNQVADCLSRPGINAIIRPSIDLERMAELQNQPTFIESLQNIGLQLEAIPLSTTPGTILCDVSRGASRPLVPSQMRHDVFSTLHNLAHPGIRTTQRLVGERFVWPSMNTDIRQWTRSCLSCQKAKVGRHNKAPIGTFLAPDARFTHVHIDLGVPSTITTNRGQQFESRPFNSLTDLLGCSRIRTTAYHPSSNGLVERFHRQLKTSLRAHDNPSHWSEHLPLAALGIRIALKPAAELVYGTTLRIPGDFFGHSQSSADLDPSDYVHRLHQAMTHLRATPPRASTTVEAFNRARKALADTTALVHSIPDAPLSIVADASNFAIGAALQQQTPTGTQPLAFYSAKLTPPQTRYSTFGRELLAIYLAIKHFRLYNQVADCLSRPGINAITRPSIDLERMAELHNQPTLTESLQNISLQLEAIPLSTTPGTILCDVSRGASRPLVPSQMRHDVFSTLRNLAHPGIRTTQHLVGERFVWPSMNTDIRQWTRSCLPCQKAKVGRHNKAPIGTFLAPDARFTHVHIDLGVPSTITTNRGQQFESRPFNSLTDLLGCSRIRTTAYHPSSNGLVERFHRQLKTSLRAHDNPSRWSEHLPLAALGIRIALKPDLECSAAELVYGTTLRIPGDFFGHSQSSADLDPSDYVHRLHQAMTHLRATPPRAPTNGVRRPLQQT
ncbi:hypothetical protein SprV_0702393300 [Sparganum proliferum]